MKKLMTMLAAAAMTFGLFATEEFKAGTFFDSEKWTLGAFNPPDTDASLTWSGATTDFTIGAVNWTNPGFENTYPYVDQEVGVYGLNIKSALNASATVKPAETIVLGENEKLYIDAMVKFTAFDEPASIDGLDAKIAVWIQEMTNSSDVVTGTNLFVTAGSVERDDVVAKIYNCGPYTAGEWCRLTVKSMGDIAGNSGVNGFVVYMNKKPVRPIESETIEFGGLTLTEKAQYFANEKMLFPALEKGEDVKGELAFAGQGAVDNIIFTTLPPPFAEDMNSVTVDWTAVTGDIGEITLTTNNNTRITLTAADLAAQKKIVYYAGDTAPEVTFKWAGTDSVMAGSKGPTQGNLTIADSDIKTAVAEFIVDTTTNKYETLTAAVDAANESATAGTIRLLDDAAANVLSFTNNATINLNGKTVAAGESGMYSITAGKNTLVAVIDDAATVGKVEGELKELGMSTNKGKLTIYAGWYKVDPSAYLAADKKAVLDQADDYYKVTDKVPVTAVAINKEALELAVDGTETLTYTVTPDGADVDTAVWSSDNTAVATVDAASGLVTAIAAGTATITITVNGTITDTCAVTVKASEITVTLTKGTGIAAIQKDAVDVTVVKGKPGNEITVTLTAESTIALPVFKADGETCERTYTVTIPSEAKTIAFTAIDATEGTEDDAAAALVDAGLTSTTVEKVGSAKALAAWWENAGEGATFADINASNYLKASVKLNVALITDATVVEVASETFAATGSDLTFNVKVGEAEVTAENVKDYVKATTDVADWTKTDGTLVTVENSKVKVAAEGDKVFAKVVIPDDAK